MTRQIIEAARKRMEKSMEGMQHGLAVIRTGRASISILDHIQANYYGTATPLNQMASLSTPDPTTIMISPWDPSTIASIEKAILGSDLGLTPTNDGKVVRLPIPPLTQERRKQLAKTVGHMAEQHRVAIRQVRHEANDQLKAEQKQKEISEDEEKDGLKKVQDLTNDFIARVDALAKKKESEILEI
jgi:ribosome recycling factor